MYSDLYTDPTRPPNFARFTFLDTAAHRFYPDWDLAADMTVANLRTAAGKDPHDKGLHDLVGELSTRSDDFRRRWGAHNVRTHGTGVKHFHHHVVGDLTLAYESLDLRAEPGLTMTIYTAEPDSPTDARAHPARRTPRHRPGSARAFYRALGYTVVGTVPDAPFGTLTMLQLPDDPFVTIELRLAEARASLI